MLILYRLIIALRPIKIGMRYFPPLIVAPQLSVIEMFISLPIGSHSATLGNGVIFRQVVYGLNLQNWKKL
jgi:hypothetical protein